MRLRFSARGTFFCEVERFKFYWDKNLDSRPTCIPPCQHRKKIRTLFKLTKLWANMWGRQPCKCVGYVKYGAPGHWSCATQPGKASTDTWTSTAADKSEIACSNEAFGGDPYPNTPKECVCLAEDANIPADYASTSIPGSVTLTVKQVVVSIAKQLKRLVIKAVCGELPSKHTTTTTTTTPTTTTKAAMSTTTTATTTTCTCNHKSRFYVGRTIKKTPRNQTGVLQWVEECADDCRNTPVCQVWVVELTGEERCLLKQADSNVLGGFQYEQQNDYYGGEKECACTTQTTTTTTTNTTCNECISPKRGFRWVQCHCRTGG